VGKGSVMSVFRYGLVGPNFQPNLLSERAPHLSLLEFFLSSLIRENKFSFANVGLLKERANG